MRQIAIIITFFIVTGCGARGLKPSNWAPAENPDMLYTLRYNLPNVLLERPEFGFEIKMGKLWERIALAETPSTRVSVAALRALIDQNGGQWVVRGEFSRELKSWPGAHRCRVFSVTELQPGATPAPES